MAEKTLIQRYWWVIVVLAGIVASIIFNWTHLVLFYLSKINHEPYVHFNFLSGDAMVNLAPMFREIIDGNWFVSDGRIFESRGLPNLWSQLDLWLAAPFLLLTKSVPLTMLLGKLFVVVASTIVLYALINDITGSRKFAVIFSTIFFPAGLLWNYLLPAAVNNGTIFDNIKMVGRSVLPLGSPPGEILLSKYNSLSTFPALIIFVIALLFLLRALTRDRLAYIVLASFFIGLNAYTYITNFVFLTGGLGILCVIFIVTRDFRRLKSVIGTWLGSLVVAVPFFVNYIKIKMLPHAHEFFLRLGGELTHEPRLSFWPRYSVYILFACIIIIAARKLKKELIGWYLASFILTSIVVFNIQVVTGFNPAPSVWWLHQLYIAFGLGFGFLFFAIYTLISWPVLKKIYVVTFLVVATSLMGRVLYTEQYAVAYSYEAARVPANIRASFDWLNTNTPKNSVVVSPALTLNSLIPFLTHNNVILPAAVTSPASEEEIIDRLLLVYTLYNVPVDYLEKGLRREITNTFNYPVSHENVLVGYLFDAYFDSTELNASLANRRRPVPENVIREILNKYRNYSNDITALLPKYRMDYLYVSDYEKSFANPQFEKAKYLEKAYDTDGVVIYRIMYEQ